MFVEKAKKLIDTHDIISFDIFDTLLLRPYLRPTDLFVHLEKLNHLPGFEARRRAAERQANHKHRDGEEITLDEIYAELSGKDVALKDQELALERQTLQPNPELQTVFNYAKQRGKRIIIVSDMYLPADFLEQVLQEKGFCGFEKLYVSNGPRKQKGSGKLYHYVQQDLKVDPATILHMGDNRRSDVRRAKKAGWHALHYVAAREQYFQKYPLWRKFWEQYPSFDASVTLGLLVLQAAQGSFPAYFTKLGYKIGGPTAYGFARWIEQQAAQRQVDNLFFVARDGYTLAEIFKTFENAHIEAHYVYALRFLNNICRLDYPPTSMGQMQTILNCFAGKSAAFRAKIPSQKMNKEQTHRFIQGNLAMLAPLAQQELARYKEYLSVYYKPGQRVGVVDSVSSFFSSQKLVEAVVGAPYVTGYYWGVTSSSASANHSFETFLSAKPGRRHSDIFTHCWPFMEFLFTAPQPPIKNISADGQPVYDAAIPLQEQARIAAYKQLSAGMLQFAKDVKRIFAGKNIFLTGEFLVKWVNWFELHPTSADKKGMAPIFHASGGDHKEYEPLLSFRPSCRFVILHLKQYITFAKQVYWKTPLQFGLTCLLSPIASQKTAAQERTFYFFPRLQKEHARTSFSLGRNTFNFVWGRRRD